MFFVNYLPEFLYQPLKLSNVHPTDFANSKHPQLQNITPPANIGIENSVTPHYSD